MRRTVLLIASLGLLAAAVPAAAQDLLPNETEIDAPPETLTGDLLRRTRSAVGPYEPLGIRSGRAILFPSLESTVGFTTNAGGSSSGSGSGFATVRPELLIVSDWARHAATFAMRGSYQTYFDGATPDEPTGAAEGTLRLDLADQWRGDLRGGYRYSQQTVSDPNFPTGADSRPGVHDLDGSAALTGGAGRLRVTLAGSAARTIYEDATSGGSIIDQGDRTNTMLGARLRVGYRGSGMLTPFAEAEISRRIYDRAVDNNGLRRGTTGHALRAGIEIDRGPILTGEVAIGVATANLEDAALADLSTLTFDGSLVWSPTELVTVNLTANTELSPSASASSSGSVTHSGGFDLAYAWKPHLTLNWRGAVSQQAFQGTGQLDLRYSAGFGATWNVNRTAQITAAYEHVWLDSNASGRSYQSDAVELRLRLQR